MQLSLISKRERRPARPIPSSRNELYHLTHLAMGRKLALPLLAPSGSHEDQRKLPLPQVKKTSARLVQIAAVDPKRSLRVTHRNGRVGWLSAGLLAGGDARNRTCD